MKRSGAGPDARADWEAARPGPDDRGPDRCDRRPARRGRARSSSSSSGAAAVTSTTLIRERRPARQRQPGAGRAASRSASSTDLKLTDDAQAEVDITVDEPLHEGTTAIVRSTSLSGIANRYISITPGPDNAPELDDGATLTADKTTSPVDLDQLFNTLNEPHPDRAQERDQGLGDDLHGRRSRGEPRLQVLRAGALVDPPPARRGDPRPAGVRVVPGRQLEGSRRPRRAPQRPLGADPERERGAGRDRAPERPRSTGSWWHCRRSCARRTRPSSTSARPSTTSTRWSRLAARDQGLPQFLRDLRPVAHRSVPVISDLALALNRDGPGERPDRRRSATCRRSRSGRRRRSTAALRR